LNSGVYGENFTGTLSIKTSIASEGKIKSSWDVKTVSQSKRLLNVLSSYIDHNPLKHLVKIQNFQTLLRVLFLNMVS
jgi:hypothetical protein